jgi:flavoprotein
MADEAPYTSSRHVVAAAVSGGADADTPVFVAPFPATVTSVQYVTPSAITGANTNTRRCRSSTRAQAGSGSTTVASLALTSGVNTVAFVPKAVTLSGTAANLVLASGDVLIWNSTHVGTGITDPGGLVVVTYSRNDG